MHNIMRMTRNTRRYLQITKKTKAFIQDILQTLAIQEDTQQVKIQQEIGTVCYKKLKEWQITCE